MPELSAFRVKCSIIIWHLKMNAAIDYREMNVLCMKYLLGRLPIQTELQLRQRLRSDRPYRYWFNWFLLKWLKVKWLKNKMTALKGSNV